MRGQAQVEFSNRAVLEQPPALANRMIAGQFLGANATTLNVLGSTPAAITDSSDNNQILDLVFLSPPGEAGALMLRAVNTRETAATVEVTVSGEAGHCARLLEAGPALNCSTMACGARAVNSWDAPRACSPKPLPTAPAFSAAHSAAGEDEDGERSCGVLRLSLPPLSFTVCGQ